MNLHEPPERQVSWDDRANIRLHAFHIANGGFVYILDRIADYGPLIAGPSPILGDLFVLYAHAKWRREGQPPKRVQDDEWLLGLCKGGEYEPPPALTKACPSWMRFVVGFMYDLGEHQLPGVLDAEWGELLPYFDGECGGSRLGRTKPGYRQTWLGSSPS